jgi:hypothetical protein
MARRQIHGVVRTCRGPETENRESVVATCVGTRRPDVEEYFVTVEVSFERYVEKSRSAYHVHNEAVGVTSKGLII